MGERGIILLCSPRFCCVGFLLRARFLLGWLVPLSGDELVRAAFVVCFLFYQQRLPTTKPHGLVLCAIASLRHSRSSLVASASKNRKLRRAAERSWIEGGISNSEVTSPGFVTVETVGGVKRASY